MSGMNKSAYNGKRMGLLGMAVALMSGLASIGSNATASQNVAAGNGIMASLRYHHRTINSSGRGNAASAKRASVKRRNIAKNPRGKHAQGGKQWKRA